MSTSKGFIKSSYTLKEEPIPRFGGKGSYNLSNPVFLSNWALVIKTVFPLPKSKFRSLKKAEVLIIPTKSFIFWIRLLSLITLDWNLISVFEGEISDIENGLFSPLVKRFLWNKIHR